MSGLNKPVFSSASAAAGGKSGAGLDCGGMINKFASAYHKKYIATSSIKPVLHLILGYSVLHWTWSQAHKHKYQTKKEFH